MLFSCRNIYMQSVAIIIIVKLELEGQVLIAL